MMGADSRRCVRRTSAGAVHHTTIDGRTAWQVRVTLARGVHAGPATCNGRQRCYSITYEPGLNTGVFSDMAAEYTALRLPGAGTTVVWSWIFGSDAAHLGVLDGVVHGLSWPGG